MKPRLLDLFCGAGGCSVGYARAGFEVVGVDIEPQPNYPFEFAQADALDVLGAVGYATFDTGAQTYDWGAFDAIHASPPCQGYSSLAARHPHKDYPKLIGPAREVLKEAGLPYVIENVEQAASALINPTMLCGSAFGLPLRRHRLFETTFPMMSPGCSHGSHRKRFKVYEHGKWRETAFVPVYGHGGGKEREEGPAAMGIDWMTRAELVEAIPPAYTEHIGSYLMAHIRSPAPARVL